MLREIHQTRRDKYRMTSPDVESKQAELTETENRMDVAGARVGDVGVC